MMPNSNRCSVPTENAQDCLNEADIHECDGCTYAGLLWKVNLIKCTAISTWELPTRGKD